MKVGMIVFAKPESGGVYQFSQSVAAALAVEAKIKPIVFLPKENGDELFLHFKSLGFEVREFSLNSFTMFMKLEIVFSYFNPRYHLKKRMIAGFEDVDLIYAANPAYYPLCFLTHNKIVTLHDLQERHLPEFFTLREKLRRRLLNATMAKECEYFLAESNSVKQDLATFLGIPFERISVIEAPPDVKYESFSFDSVFAARVRQKYSLPDCYLYYPAHFWPHKNHVNLLKAFGLVLQMHPESHLVLSGSKQNYFNEVFALVKELGLTEKVKYLGYVDPAELPYLFKLSKMVVVPSLFESISIPIFEAFSLGVPVASSNVCALPEQVLDAALLFDPRNIEEMASKIEAILSDHNLQKDLSLKGHARMKSFSGRVFLEKFLSHYQEIVL